MKTFNLERALAGDPVVTRDSREVEQLFYADKIKSDCKLFVVINGEANIYTDNGSYLCDTGVSRNDLFMAPKKRTVWVNFKSTKDNNGSNGEAFYYSSKIEAQGMAQLCKYIAIAVPVEIEE